MAENKTVRQQEGGESGEASVRFLPSGSVFSDIEDGILLAPLPELTEGNYSYVLTAPGYKEITGTLVAHTA